ncbi:MAG: PHP domain-containing protein [Desulfamplus sp.]|nr:PHP domain-containing protein [Desulfamplus sp.]
MEKYIYADMHNHTTASDGELSPEELVRKAKSIGIAVVGVTDHDTDKGLESAIKEGEKIGVNVLPGVEISVRFKESFFTGTLHVLLYFNHKIAEEPIFRESLRKTLEKGRGDNLVRARVDEINKFFAPENIISTTQDTNRLKNNNNLTTTINNNKKVPILKRSLTFEEVASYSTTITRRHFALALTEKHNIKNPEVVNKIIGNDSPAYLPSGVDLESIKSFFYSMNKLFGKKGEDRVGVDNSNKNNSPMLMVLAHPAAGSFPGDGHYKDVLPPIEIVEQLLPRFIDAGIRGIEINYPGHIEAHKVILHQWAKQYSLVITGGSDCHDQLIRPLGVEGITREEFEKLNITAHTSQSF